MFRLAEFPHHQIAEIHHYCHIWYLSHHFSSPEKCRVFGALVEVALTEIALIALTGIVLIALTEMALAEVAALAEIALAEIALAEIALLEPLRRIP